ncbi:hypothetical protein CYLTODRAFT_447478 [Cylindrobasidium torrendii FP15055 ss-10]|uniref:Uncharacterized protein n=1 Tax=Cylindrobasidium torrendii FP15055 ss-10 TaxID=1314674 RepID=A0A0D7AV96_9AGAR|nr:hypothetical protein CYLTODRAFT_447478 [Cylindrobasidium torrendii FP15055 ss-10]
MGVESVSRDMNTMQVPLTQLQDTLCLPKLQRSCIAQQSSEYSQRRGYRVQGPEARWNGQRRQGDVVVLVQAKINSRSCHVGPSGLPAGIASCIIHTGCPKAVAPYPIYDQKGPDTHILSLFVPPKRDIVITGTYDSLLQALFCPRRAGKFFGGFWVHFRIWIVITPEFVRIWSLKAGFSCPAPESYPYTPPSPPHPFSFLPSFISHAGCTDGAIRICDPNYRCLRFIGRFEANLDAVVLNVCSALWPIVSKTSQ